MPSLAGSQPVALLQARDDASCPQDNGTIWSADGYSWAILCNYDFPGFDLPSQPAKSLTQCIDACNNYKQDENYLDGASCIAVVYGAGNDHGNPCYLKARIDTVTSGARLQYVARRTQYQVGDAAVYTSIKPSATSSSPQPSTSASTPILVVNSSTDLGPTRIATQAPAQKTQAHDSLLQEESSLVPNSTPSRDTSESRPTQGSSYAQDSLVISSSVDLLGSKPSGVTGLPAVQTQTTDQTETNSSTASSANSSPASSTSNSIVDSSSSSGLSDGAKIGIGVGIGVLAAIIFGLLFYIFYSRRKRQANGNSIMSSEPAELPLTFRTAGMKSDTKPTLLPATDGFPNQAKYTEKYPGTAMQEFSSPAPAASELHSPTYHELYAGTSSPELGNTESSTLRASNTGANMSSRGS